jgi:tRNA (cytidine32/uridine32-2'-O)-methyltransferase
VVTPTQAAKIMFDFIDKQTALDVADNNQNTKLSENAQSTNKPNIAILFGREDRGLTNEELAYADYHIQIDANPAYPVLNVASAVQVIASFIFAYAQTHNQATTNRLDNDKDATIQPTLDVHLRQQWDEPAISQQQLQQLTQRTTELMVQRGLADSENLKSLPSRLSRLGSRLQLDQKEYQLLSALIAKLAKD